MTSRTKAPERFLCVDEEGGQRCIRQCANCKHVEEREAHGKPPRDIATASPYDLGNPTKDYPGE